jgi:hypothetical protein
MLQKAKGKNLFLRLYLPPLYHAYHPVNPGLGPAFAILPDQAYYLIPDRLRKNQVFVLYNHFCLGNGLVVDVQPIQRERQMSTNDFIIIFKSKNFATIIMKKIIATPKSKE